MPTDSMVNGPGQLVPSCENITEFEFVDRLKF